MIIHLLQKIVTSVGWYRYTYTASRGLVSIEGPYLRREYAENFLGRSHLYARIARFHWKKPILSVGPDQGDDDGTGELIVTKEK